MIEIVLREIKIQKNERLAYTVSLMNLLQKLIRESVRPIKRYYARRRDSGYAIKVPSPPTYNQDGLISFHNTSFMEDPAFQSAYQRGVEAAGKDYRFHWRVHVALWIASHAINLEGDFVECGVNKGVLSSCIMKYLNWNERNRNFYLFDTFCGLDETVLLEEEAALGLMEKSKVGYRECFEEVKQNFKEFKNVQFIRGTVPATLDQVEIPKVCYVSIDMNCANPEIAAAQRFWPKMTQGAMMLLDDYAYGISGIQKKAFDQFAKERNTQVLSLPTGQGLLIKST